MPILPSEPDIFPESLLEDCLAEASPGQWWALYTLSRRQKDLMRRLRKRSVAFYSPLVKQRTRSPGGRIRTSYLPLFANYVFLFGTEDDRRTALATNCVSRCLEVADGIKLASDLLRMRQLVLCGAPLTPESRLEPGVRVRVKTGLLAGVEGTVIRRQGKERLLVAVEFLQQGASLSLEDITVQRID